MVKNILSNLSRGIFYTIGKVIAWLLIGLGIVLLAHYLKVGPLLGVIL